MQPQSSPDTTVLRSTDVFNGAGGGTQSALEERRPYQQAADVLKALAASEEFFQQPKIDGPQGLVEILDQMDPTAKVTVFDNETEPQRTANGDIVREFKVQMPSKKADEKPVFAHVFELVKGKGKKKRRLAYVDVLGLESGKNRGNALYGAVAAWAHVNDITFISDPNGLTEMGARRRTEMMLSSALKYGLTRHVKPGSGQLKPADFGLALHPLKWGADDTENLSQLIETSYKNTLLQFPELADFRYNLEHGRFERKTGSDAGTDAWAEAGSAFFKDLARSKRGRAAGAGETTLKRAVVIESLVQETAGGAGRGSPSQGLARLLHSERLDKPLYGLFYQPADGSAPRGSFNPEAPPSAC